MPEAVVIGGPNGAGKTSWALRRLNTTLGLLEFLNADEIARGLSPLNPDSAAFSAGRILIEQLHTLAELRQSFAFETTCAGHAQVRFLEKCREAGYRISLIFLWLPSAENAIARVARRVREGGHSVPAPVIKRRYVTGLRNMRHFYLPLAEIAAIYDNSDQDPLHRGQLPSRELVVHDSARWVKIEEVTR